MTRAKCVVCGKYKIPKPDTKLTCCGEPMMPEATDTLKAEGKGRKQITMQISRKLRAKKTKPKSLKGKIIIRKPS